MPIPPENRREALLQVWRDHHSGGVCAGAVFGRVNGQWRCIRAAPILQWMYKTPVAAIPAELRRRRYRYHWID